MRFLVVMLLAACAPDVAPDPADPIEAEAPALAPAAVAAPVLKIATSEAGLANPTITSAPIAGTTDIYVRVVYPLAPPAGESRLDVVLPTGALLLSVDGRAEGHFVNFVIPVAGAPIGKRGLGGEYSLVAHVGGANVAGALLTLTEVTP